MRIGLGQEDERRRAALPGDQEEALEAPRRERMVERVRHDDDVDVRGDDGRRARIVRHAALEQRAPLEHGGDAASPSTTSQSPTARSASRWSVATRSSPLAARSVA